MASGRKLDYAELWMRDGIDVCVSPAYFVTLDVDMTQSRALIEAARRLGTRITYVHILVRAGALALAEHPELHRMVCGNRVHTPAQVDIALSVGGDMTAAPLLIVENADRKLVPDIACEVVQRVSGIREADRKRMQALRRWGWTVPFGILRRMLLRGLFRNPELRRKGAGTFQISVLPGVDQALSPVFSASAALFAGEVKEKVFAVNGKPVVRPAVTLSCCADHRVWDGLAGQRYLATVRRILESSVLMNEIEPPEPSTEGLVAVIAGNNAH